MLTSENLQEQIDTIIADAEHNGKENTTTEEEKANADT